MVRIKTGTQVTTALQSASIVGAMEALDDPHVQPALDPSNMLYTARPEDVAWAPGSVPILGQRLQPHFRHVRLDHGVVAALLASIAAIDPENLAQRFGRSPEDDRLCVLHLFGSGDNGTAASIDICVDTSLPTHPNGKVWGAPANAAQDADIAAWPYLLSKGIDKVLALRRYSHGERKGKPSFVNVHYLLRGKASKRAKFGTAAANALLARVAAGKHGKGMSSPACVTFCDAAELAHRGLGRDCGAAAALGGLGIRLQLWRNTLDVMVLSHHSYAIVGFDNAQAPTRVILYNPLGYNTSPSRSPAKVRDAEFFVPEDLVTLERTQGTFFLPIAALQKFGMHLEAEIT